MAMELLEVYSKRKNEEILIGDYFEGAIGCKKTLEINFELPKSHQFVESLVLIAPKSKNNKNEEKSDRNTKTKKKNKNFENDKTFNKMTSEKLVDDERFLLNFAVDQIPCYVNGTMQLISWTNGNIVQNGPYVSSRDLGRAVYSEELKSKIFLAKQLKIMTKKGLSNKNEKDFAVEFLKKLKTEYDKVKETMKKMEKDCEENWGFVFVFLTNWPVNPALLDISELPENAIFYCESNIKEHYSRIIHSRLIPWIKR